MTAQIKALFRQSILLQLAQASSMGLPVPTVTQGCKLAGCVCDDDLVEAELAGFLSEQGYVRNKSGAMHTALSRWEITGAGRQYLQTQGLA